MKNNTIEFELGEMMMIYRKRAHLTKKAVAKSLKVSPATISNYESRKTLPSYRKILRLKRVLGEEFDDVLKIIEETDGCFCGRIS